MMASEEQKVLQHVHLVEKEEGPVEVVVSSWGVVQGEVQKVASGSDEPSFQGEQLGQVVQEDLMVAAYPVEVGVGGTVKFLGVIIHQAVRM